MAGFPAPVSEAEVVLRKPHGSQLAFDIVRTALGFVLVMAAVLKGWQLATQPVLEKGLLSSRWLLITQVECEMVLGLWLWSGLCRQHARLVSLVCFTIFSLVAAYKAATGAESCGCFGKVPVPPKYTFAFDTAAVACLAFCRPGKQPMARCRRWWRPAAALIFVAIAVAVGVPGAILMATHVPGVVMTQGAAAKQGDIVVLEPRTWVGQAFPLLAYIDIEGQLRSGKWIVLLYHEDCPNCSSAISAYQQGASEVPAGTDVRIGFIAMPPVKSAEHPQKVGCAWGLLDGAIEWFGETPIVVLLRNGMVLRAWEAESPSFGNLLNELSSRETLTNVSVTEQYH